MNMLEKIQSRLENLSKSERKVAEVILATPAQAIHSSIAALALEAGVSEPTVKPNFGPQTWKPRGLAPTFKLHLAQSLAHGTLYVNRNVDEDDSVESYTAENFRIGDGQPRSGTSCAGYVRGQPGSGSTYPGEENFLLRPGVFSSRRA